jgi:hypothetical protein
MAFRFALLALFFGCGLAEKTAMGANPIRKVVTLMQNMQKEVEAEGAKEKELFDKFMCFCGGSGSAMATAIEVGKAKIEELTAKVKSEEAEKVQLGQELVDHKKDREGAKADLAEATTLRQKESAEFEAMSAESKTNIEGLASAIPAIEKGMGGASFIQTPLGSRVVKLIESFPQMDPMDRRQAIAFLQGGDSAESGGAGEILGIMKQMKETMEANLAEAVADEEKAAAGFADLEASKNKEIEVATESIESKTVRSGELAVSVVQTKNALEDTIEEVADNEKFSAQLDEQCASKEKEWAVRQKARADEVQAISEAIGILNDDDALDVFKKAVPGDAAAFLQRSSPRTRASKAKNAQAILAHLAAHKGVNSQELHLILYSMNSKLRLAAKGKVQKFDEIKKMIDDMVALLGKEQKDDDKQKEFCRDEFDRTADEEVAAKEKVAAITATIEEATDSLAQTTEEIATLQQEIKDIDKAVAQATEQRKEEHEESVAAAQMSQAALQLVDKAKNRLAKFYNPSTAKAALVQEPQEGMLFSSSFVQIKSHTRAKDFEDDDQPEAPETFSGEVKKNEKSAGVIGMMDQIIRDLENDMKDAEYEEKTAQSDYAKLMGESEATRQQDTKSIADKEATKADLEAKLVTDKETARSNAEELANVQTAISDLHGTCDFIVQNYDLRKEARTNEIDALKNAKAMLSGAVM